PSAKADRDLAEARSAETARRVFRDSISLVVIATDVPRLGASLVRLATTRNRSIKPAVVPARHCVQAAKFHADCRVNRIRKAASTDPIAEVGGIAVPLLLKHKRSEPVQNMSGLRSCKRTHRVD